MNIYDTLYMLAAIEELTPEPTFFKRRYFPTDLAMDVSVSYTHLTLPTTPYV